MNAEKGKGEKRTHAMLSDSAENNSSACGRASKAESKNDDICEIEELKIVTPGEPNPKRHCASGAETQAPDTKVTPHVPDVPAARRRNDNEQTDDLVLDPSLFIPFFTIRDRRPNPQKVERRQSMARPLNGYGFQCMFKCEDQSVSLIRDYLNKVNSFLQLNCFYNELFSTVHYILAPVDLDTDLILACFFHHPHVVSLKYWLTKKEIDEKPHRDEAHSIEDNTGSFLLLFSSWCRWLLTKMTFVELRTIVMDSIPKPEDNGDDDKEDDRPFTERVYFFNYCQTLLATLEKESKEGFTVKEQANTEVKDLDVGVLTARAMTGKIQPWWYFQYSTTGGREYVQPGYFWKPVSEQYYRKEIGNFNDKEQYNSTKGEWIRLRTYSSDVSVQQLQLVCKDVAKAGILTDQGFRSFSAKRIGHTKLHLSWWGIRTSLQPVVPPTQKPSPLFVSNESRYGSNRFTQDVKQLLMDYDALYSARYGDHCLRKLGTFVYVTEIMYTVLVCPIRVKSLACFPLLSDSEVYNPKINRFKVQCCSCATDHTERWAWDHLTFAFWMESENDVFKVDSVSDGTNWSRVLDIGL